MKTFLKLSASALTLSIAATSAQADGKLSVYHWFEYIRDSSAEEINVLTNKISFKILKRITNNIQLIYMFSLNKIKQNKDLKK